MSRYPRLQIAGSLYHVTSRGNRGEPIYRTRRDARTFLDMLDTAIVSERWLCHAYCLMPNHYHLLVETPLANLSHGMHRVNRRYARWFNVQRDCKGHLFERRFHASLIETDGHLLESLRYIALNPVRAGLCLDPALWEWSSYRDLLLEGTITIVHRERVLGLFGEGDEGRKRLARFVADGVLPAAA
ncbi:MAG: REP-associated tyrosine transposase [Gaiellaceae bacterium]